MSGDGGPWQTEGLNAQAMGFCRNLGNWTTFPDLISPSAVEGHPL